MSSIPTKQIDGDAAVGRHVTAGGNATVRGSVAIGHNLKVDGWLDAPNIKGASKGLFATEEQLAQTYPAPQNGDWALVGATLPASLWRAWGGVWRSTGTMAGTLTVDAQAYEYALSEYEKKLDNARADIHRLESSIAGAERQIEEHAARIDALEQGGPDLSGIEERLAAVERGVAANRSAIEHDRENIGSIYTQSQENAAAIERMPFDWTEDIRRAMRDTDAEMAELRALVEAAAGGGGECGCEALSAEEIAAVWGEDAPDTPRDGERIDESELDDLIDSF